MRALIVLFLLVMGFFWLAKPGSDQSPTSKLTVAVDAKNAEVERYLAKMNRKLSVELTKFSWQKGGFDNVMLGTFTLKNTNDFPVKDIVITCEHTANSGTLIDSNTRTIYEAIKAKGTKTIRKFNMGLINTQVARSTCRVADFVGG